MKARSSAIIALKALIVNAPGELRETLEPLTDRQLIKRCADLEPGDLIDPTASIKHALRALATRWLTLSTEIGAHDEALDTLTMTAAPSLREAYGIGPDSAAEMMIVAGDNPCTDPIRSRVRQALWRLPDPRLDRDHEPAPALPRRPPPSQRGTLPDRDRPHALAPTDPRLRYPTHRSGAVQKRHHPLPEAIRRA